MCANILIVDDEAITLMYLQEQLILMGHNVVAKANSGPKAVELVRISNPDLVFMDINMPGEYDGVTAARIIESEYNIPIIFLTAYSTNHYIQEIQKFGPFGYIVKPFKEAEIKVAIHIALYRSKMENKLKKSIEKYKEQILNEKLVESILSRLNSFYDPYEDLDSYLNLIVEYLKLWKLKIFVYDKSTQSLVNINQGNSSNISAINLNDFQVYGMTAIQKIHLIYNFKTLPNYILEFINNNEVRSVISLPLFVENNFYGVMFCLNRERKYFGQNTINVLKIISNALSFLFKRHFDHLKLEEAKKEQLAYEQFKLRSERLISLGQLATSIGHEINQPLQSIKILADSVIFWNKENNPLPYEKVMENLKKISERVNKVDKIIKNMKIMTKSPEKIELQELNINLLLEEIISFYQNKEKGINFISLYDSNIKNIMFSEVQLQQIVINLIENSINASTLSKKNDKYIRVETIDKDSFVFLIISDNAIGIPPENLEKIFDPFFSTYQKKDGMGMGLFIVNNILKSFNSLIEVSNNDNGGATFKISINKNPQNY